MKTKENATEKAEKNNSIKAEFVKMLNRTEQQITEAQNRKEIAVDTYNRDLQQLYKDQERLNKMIEGLK